MVDRHDWSTSSTVEAPSPADHGRHGTDRRGELLVVL
jgi:hypothetical protein